MRKENTRFFVILLISLVLLSSVLLMGTRSRKPLELDEIKSSELETLISDKTEVSILEEILLFDGEIPAIDSTEKAIYIPQSLNENSWQGKLYLDGKKPSEKIYLVVPEQDKLGAMADNNHYQICYIDNKASIYQVMDLVVSGLPIMNICNDEMRLYSADNEKIDIEIAEAAIEQRGQTTYHYDKKSYNLKLKENFSLLGLRTDEDWILNALYDDMGLIHNQLSYQVWNEIAATEDWQGNYAANQEYIELLIDGEYQGVYALSERVDKQQLMLSDDDILFKVKGYLQHTGGEAIETKYPEESTFESDALKAVILEHFCEDNEIPLKNSLILLDYDNALDYNIFCNISAAADNSAKNSYLIGRRAQDFYKVCEVPWDCNITWGIKHFVLTKEERIYDTEFKSLVFSVLEKKEPQSVDEDVAKRWFFLREEILTEENLKSILDENFSVLHDSGAYERNYQRWPTVSVNVGEEGEILDAPVSEIWDDSNIYHFVELRLPVLDEYYHQFL